jgi:uncharacterized protein (DUF4415 family)
MTRGESTKIYSGEELAAMRLGGKDRTDWGQVDRTTDEQLEQLVAEDEEERELAPDWANAFLVLPEPKAQITLRVDRDVLRFFKSQGQGYQTRMNAVLRSYVLAHRGKSGPAG